MSGTNNIYDHAEGLRRNVVELTAINAELLAALRECLANLAPCNNGPVNRQNCPTCLARNGAEKAIAKVEGRKV